jgi:hypothetical protein
MKTFSSITTLKEMLAADLKDSLKADQESSAGYDQAVGFLNDFATELQSSLHTEVCVGRGQITSGTSAGIEHSMIVSSLNPIMLEILFVARVPIEGFPVNLNLFAEYDILCHTPEELVRALTELPRHQNIKAKLRMIRQALAPKDRA